MPKLLSFSGTDEEFEWAKLSEAQLIYWGQMASRLTLLYETKMNNLVSSREKSFIDNAYGLEFNPGYELHIKRHSKYRDPDGLTMKEIYE